MLLTSKTSEGAHVVALDTAALTSQADLVVRGIIVDIQAEAVPEAVTRIHTRATLTVQELFKSQIAGFTAGMSIDIYTPGGILGRYGQWSPGAPRFQPGEEVVLFLSRHPHTGRFFVLGLSQGRYVVDRTLYAEGMTASDHTGLQLMAKSPGGQWGPTVGSTRFSRMTLPELRRQIRTVLAE
jgi:hypothetical protein